jgi:hypothetical protein
VVLKRGFSKNSLSLLIMRWYADNSELRGLKEAEIPDIHLLGGIAVSSEPELALRSSIEKIKEKYFGDKRAPIKWNFKDLEKIYKRFERIELFNDMFNKQTEWRKAIFEAGREHDFTIIISVVEGYSSRRAVLKEKHNDLTRFVFSNGLMRYALHVQELSPKTAEVILDWPDSNNSSPFDTEYAHAYSVGKTKEKIEYKSGPLRNLHFHDSVFFTKMYRSTLLQFADLIIGATREFINCCFQRRNPGEGIDVLRAVSTKFLGYPYNVIGRGIIVNSAAKDIKDSVRKGFRKWLVVNKDD